jgi:hydroxypyruvate isomerase
MSDSAVCHSLTRREWLGSAILAPAAIGARAQQAPAPAAAAPLGPPPYTLSINIEIMFNRANLSKADRIRAVADKGFKAYGFWSANPEERAAMLKAQQETGLKCSGIVGTGPSGGTTGFTQPSAADTLLNEVRERAEIARQFGGADLICFVGRIQDNVPWDVQRKSIVEGMKRAGDIAAAAGVTFMLEPLSVGPNQPRRALDRAADAFPVIAEVNHPNVKVCFDLYHLQRTEGNLTVNLRRGLEEKLIKIVQIGDNPGRLEPGTGEINYAFIFKELRRLGWSGYVDTEMGTSSTPDHAMEVTRKLSLEN